MNINTEHNDKLFSLAIVGRPNVGKSTLFNRLAGKKLAIIDDLPGVTRDRKETRGQLVDLVFKLIDTAGLEEAFDETLEARMREQTDKALADADCILFMIDSQAGIMPMDEHFAHIMRSMDKPVILIANKSESKASEHGVYESYALGLGDPVCISAEHGEGMANLFEALQPHTDKFYEENPLPSEDDEDEKDNFNYDVEEIQEETIESLLRGKPLQLAIVGRPNAGKSTLINALVKEERLLTGPEAGITRDSIAIDWNSNGIPIKLVDTAGLRRRSKIDGRIEKFSAMDTHRAIKYAQIVILMLDANLLMEKQDLTIAQEVVKEGRGLVIAINKWDMVEDPAKTLKAFEDRLEISLPQVKGVPVITISAKTKRNLSKIIPKAIEVFKLWNKRIPTGKLNRWLEFMQEAHPAPLTNGRRIRMRYATQIKTRPPTFMLFTNKPADLADSYLRYLANGMRKDFDLPSTPIRMLTKKGDNPYAPKGKK